MSYKKRTRRERIMAVVVERGAISVGALAEMLDVSMQTIRRDIDELCEGEGLRRLHGRVELAEQRLNTPFDQRTGTNFAGKQAIGEAAARLIPDGSSLFISIGSTPLSVARALRGRKGLTVITNNLSAAMALSDEVSNRIILPGGEVRLPDRDILGRSASTVFERHRADFGIYGVGGIDDDGALLDFHQPEIEAREAIRRNARRSILVADCSKFGRTAPAIGGMLGEADHIVTDSRPDARFAPLVERLGDRVIIASEVGQ